jgi:putative ABC transport system permease protein
MMNRQKLIGIRSKGSISVKGKHSPWITLFVLQFSASIVLISFALFSTKQINDLMKVNTGIQTHQILAIRSADSSEDPEISTVRAVFESEVLKIPGVAISSSASYIPGSCIASYMPTHLSFKTKDDNIDCRMNFVGYDYIPLFRHKIVAGRNFSKNYSSDSEAVVINKTLAQAYGFVNPEEALGKEIFWESKNKYKTIIGVMDDFYQQSADVAIEPTMFQLWDHARGYCLLNILSANATATIKEVEKLWNKIHKGNAFDYLWIDEHYNKQFDKWIQYAHLVKTFSLIAILIACVGLFGLSSMLLGNRTKEIGIRKINGANEITLIQLLNKDFIIWVVVAFVIACPISWFTLNKWLENFAYKTTLSWWIYALAGMVALCIAIVTISLQTFKAVRMNPVEALRYE